MKIKILTLLSAYEPIHPPAESGFSLTQPPPMLKGMRVNSTCLNTDISRITALDRLQAMIGILMSRDGIPIAHHVFLGNTPDTGVFMEAVSDLKKRFNIQRIIGVGDRGMMEKRTLELLEGLKLQYILEVRMRNIKLLLSGNAPAFHNI